MATLSARPILTQNTMVYPSHSASNGQPASAGDANPPTIGTVTESGGGQYLPGAGVSANPPTLAPITFGGSNSPSGLPVVGRGGTVPLVGSAPQSQHLLPSGTYSAYSIQSFNPQPTRPSILQTLFG